MNIMKMLINAFFRKASKEARNCPVLPYESMTETKKRRLSPYETEIILTHRHPAA